METERTILRPWEERDAESLYALASDPAVGPIAGWMPHTSVEYSQRIIREVLSAPGTYAIVSKDNGAIIGCIGLMFAEQTSLACSKAECELGYWLGFPYWGQGIMTEVAKEILRHAFADLGMQKVWCGYYEGNERSAAVQRKCGFCFVKKEVSEVPQLGEQRTAVVSCLTKETWKHVMN